MIKQLLLINSANFNFLEVDLQKDLFFLGDNGSGKTTVIRALQYLFSGDVRSLGIPSDKEGFKEYYFRYANSYIIYVFDDFFIFMYKVGGEIVKLFSKQKFDICKIIDENRELYGLDEIKRYAKMPNLRKTVKSLSEYREIIYGNHKEYLDFRFIPIKNSDTFIGLFNEIFNIDKSIIDSKSIKKAIQTTLDYEKRVIDFNHEEYLQKIYEFQAEYKFFKEFERQKVNIEKAAIFKEELGLLEHDIEELKGHIVYSEANERIELNQMAYNSILKEKELTKTKETLKIKVNSLRKCEEKFKTLSNNLELEIERITLLKEKFLQENVLKNKGRADRYEEIQDDISKLDQDYIKIMSGFEDQVQSINKEIKELVYKRDKELLREQEGKKFHKIQYLEILLKEDIQKVELEFEAYKSRLEYGIIEIKEDIFQFEESLQKQKSVLLDLKDSHQEKVKNLKSEYAKNEELQHRQIKENFEAIDIKKREIREFGYSLEDLERNYKIVIVENEKSYNIEQERLKIQIQKYQNMIFSIPNSFKEFLNDEVDDWEYKLYPIIDETLLDMDIDLLKPKFIAGERIFSIEVQKEHLKKMLTKDEANTKIEALAFEQDSLSTSYKEVLLKIEFDYIQEKEVFQQGIEFIEQDIKALHVKIEKGRNELELAANELQNIIAELKKSHDIEGKKQNQEIRNLQIEIQHNYDEIEENNKKIRESKNSTISKLKELSDENKRELQFLEKELNVWLTSEQGKVDELIAQKELEKHNISKDERIKQLEDVIKSKKIELSQSIRAQEFLREYEKSKEEIATFLQKKSRLESIKLKNSEFKKRLDFKIDKYKNQIDKLSEEKISLLKREKNLKKGLEGFDALYTDFDGVTSRKNSEFLYLLLEKYSSFQLKYSNKKIDLKTILDKINALKNTQNEIDIYFKFDEYDSHKYISQTPNILLKIDEIIEYKNKKLEIVKQNGHKKFINFVNNLLPQKMSIFSDSEDKFISQVAKINKNLADIDFGVIKNIRLDTKVGDKKSIARLLNDLHDNVANLSSLLNESSLFYEKDDVLVALNKLELKFKEIKSELKGDSISLQDTIDLSLSFNENGKQISQVSQLKNESSTGGSMLLKIAIAVAILKLFIKEDETPFFLIVDEVSRLHSENQEKLRIFANSKGFSIVFVTPEPTLSKPDVFKYYRFRKNIDNEFEAIELNI